jgi:hypothetical protein
MNFNRTASDSERFVGGDNYGEEIYRHRFSCAGKRRFRAGAEYEFVAHSVSDTYRSAKTLSHAETGEQVHRR